MNILEKIVVYKKELLDHEKKLLPFKELLLRLGVDLPEPGFLRSIAQGPPHLIAEVKKASPSAGVIREDYDPAALAQIYEEAGASCVSVLTEDKFFAGGMCDLNLVRQAVSLPVLRKDFIIDPYQIYETKLYRADAVLLIASILEASVLKDFVSLCAELRLDALVEVHNERDLKKALGAGAMLLGINSRNLSDFSIHLEVVPELMKKMPAEAAVVCESGLRSVSDIEFVVHQGARAVLIGEALMRAQNPFEETRRFVQALRKS